MKKTAKLALTVLMASAVLLTSFTLQNAKAYTPPYTTVKIGLYYGGSALPSANLQNVTGSGSGFEFGVLNDQRQFTPFGASTPETKISIIKDKNMVYDSANNCYTEGTSGGSLVGCYHIQLGGGYGTYGEAQAAALQFPDGFVKYSSGTFYACVGSYISSDDAGAASMTNGAAGTIICGNDSTVTVVKTGTNKILFEFEYGNAYWLVVMPVSPDGVKCQTWFKGYRYYGGFQYARLGAGDLTVINCIDVEDYTKGVIPYEMVGNAPLEAYKAQAVCARTYAMANLGNKHKGNGFDLCTTEDCQVYRGIGAATDVTNMAVEQSAGMYMTYGGQLCIAYYSSCDGGATENSENVWKDAVPYLRGVADPYEADIASTASGYKWTVTYTPAEITARLQGKGYKIGNITKMAVTQYTDIGNVFKVTVYDDVGGSLTFAKGDTIRSALGVSSIRFSINGGSGTQDTYVNSNGEKITGGLGTFFAIGGNGIPELLGQNNVYAITGTGETVAMGPDAPQASTPSTFVIKGTGKGHNVGMSQWGAYSMAKFHNMTYDQILSFYFTGVTIG
jgi:stage II sporulation protein D